MEVTVYTRRWIVLLIYCLYGLSNQVQYVAFSTIVRELQDYYRISSLQVNVLTAMFPIIYVMLVFPGCTVYEAIGLRGGLLIGAGFNAIGSVLKLLAVWIAEYWILLIAQLFNAVSQVFFLALPPLVASTWFPDNERTLATALGTLSGFVGMAIGMFYSPQLVEKHSTTKNFGVLFGSQCCLGVVVFLGVLLFVDPSPPSSPSLTANRRTERVAVWPVLREQLKNKNVVLLCLCFGLVNGLYTGLAAVLSQIMQPFGVTEDQTGLIALCGILSGAVGCGVVAPFVDRHRQYKKPIIFFFGIVGLLAAMTSLCMKVISNDFVTAAFVLTILIELMVLPVMPIVLELSVELTYPHPETICSSLAIASLSFWSVVGIGIFSAILGDTPTQSDSFTLMTTVVVINFVAVFLMFFVKEDCLRLAKEREGTLIGTSQL
jgi:MFS transporter, FLVCR family, feline leukemia virus subgroup C receptor-related protein